MDLVLIVAVFFMAISNLMMLLTLTASRKRASQRDKQTLGIIETQKEIIEIQRRTIETMRGTIQIYERTHRRSFPSPDMDYHIKVNGAPNRITSE